MVSGLLAVGVIPWSTFPPIFFPDHLAMVPPELEADPPQDAQRTLVLPRKLVDLLFVDRVKHEVSLSWHLSFHPRQFAAKLRTRLLPLSFSF